jgi:Zn-dependent protease with chaperone function
MGFFELQESARRSTTRLVLLFVLAVVLIIASLYAVAVLALHFTTEGAAERVVKWWDPSLLVSVAALGVALIGGASLHKIISLRGGGAAVATMLGGRRVHPETAEGEERKLLNVVEEMAIASGTPVPEVYLLERERGINAFAAGYTRSDAAIAVTSGCLSELTREELEGVVAHELSHVLNGDMRVNIRLIGLLQGILVIASLGYILLRAAGWGAMRRSRQRNDGATIVILFVGVALLIIGSAGVFIGRLIKSAVSRQREFLADASAMQFTRNPSGLAGALKKIAAHTHGSLIQNPHAEEASHLFFENALKVGLLRGWLATHPPIEVRLARLEPGGETARAAEVARAEPVPLRQALGAAAAFAPLAPVALAPGDITEAVGSPAAADLARGKRLIEQVPSSLRRAAQELLGAVAIVCGLLLDRDPERRRSQQKVLEERTDLALRRELRALGPSLDALPLHLRLPLVELTAPALRQLSSAQRVHVQATVQELIRADGELSVFEFALEQTLLRELDGPGTARSRRAGSTYPRGPKFSRDVSVLLSAVAWAGSRERPGAERAYAAGLRFLSARGIRPPSSLASLERGLGKLEGALDCLLMASPAEKRCALEAAAHVVLADRRITLAEAELLRVLASALDCPLPPLALDEEPPHAAPQQEL